VWLLTIELAASSLCINLLSLRSEARSGSSRGEFSSAIALLFFVVETGDEIDLFERLKDLPFFLSMVNCYPTSYLR
jgi:hypothetical protein